MPTYRKFFIQYRGSCEDDVWLIWGTLSGCRKRGVCEHNQHNRFPTSSVVVVVVVVASAAIVVVQVVVVAVLVAVVVAIVVVVVVVVVVVMGLFPPVAQSLPFTLAIQSRRAQAALAKQL